MIPTPDSPLRRATLPTLTGLAKFQTNNVLKTTYTNDFRKRRQLDFILDDIPTLRVRRTADFSRSNEDLSLSSSFTNEFKSNSARFQGPLYHEKSGQLKKIFEPKKVNGVDYFRSHFDHNDIAKEKHLDIKTLYEIDFPSYTSAPRFPQIKPDRFYQTNGSKNVKFLRSNNGVIYHF